MLLDTNILVHYVREADVWPVIREKYDLFVADPRPVISTVTEGELRSLALKWGWGDKLNDRMEFALSQFERAGIDDRAIIDCYAEIDYHTFEEGFKLSKNDLWIAATAKNRACTLLSSDLDFQPLARTFITFDWINPKSP